MNADLKRHQKNVHRDGVLPKEEVGFRFPNTACSIPSGSGVRNTKAEKMLVIFAAFDWPKPGAPRNCKFPDEFWI